MFICKISNLTVTSTLPIPYFHVSVFSTFFVNSNPPFSKACVSMFTKVRCLRFLVLLEAESSAATGFSQAVGLAWNLKSFNIMIDWKSIIRLHFYYYYYYYYYCFFICCRTKITRLTLKVVTIDLSIFGIKKAKIYDIPF